MHSLCTNTQELWDGSYKAFHKAFTPQILTIDCEDNEDFATKSVTQEKHIRASILKYLLHGNRYASYKLVLNLESKEDSAFIIEFLNSVNPDLLILKKVIHSYYIGPYCDQALDFDI